MMLLTIDAGNTNINMGLMDNDRVAGGFRLTTRTPRTSDEFGMALMTFFSSLGVKADDIEDVIISSVVPKIMYALTSAIIKYVDKTPLIITSQTPSGISVQTDNPNEVGADRIVNVAAAFHIYRRPSIIVDFGTATTFDYVSADGVFEYTVIAPGLGISAAALTQSTAKLPEVEIRKPDKILVKNTVDGMQAGVVYGYIGQVEYIIAKMKEELANPDILVIATGGLGKVIASQTKIIEVYDQDLAYKGMRFIYEEYKKGI